MADFVPGSGKEIILTDWAPDLDPSTKGVITDSFAAVPTMKGYAARNAPISIVSTPFAATPTGAYIALFADGTDWLYAYGGGHFYQLRAGAWVNVDGNVVYPATGRVRLTQFNDDVIATAKGFTVPLVAAGAAGTFAPLGGSPPANAVTVISVGGFVVFFAGSNWYSSAAGVDNDYVPDIQTLANMGTLYDVPGDIVAAASLYRSIIAFKAGAVWVGTFSGPPFTWSFQLISGQIGTYGQECVVTLPDSVAFLGTDDFYITTGYTPQRIPNSMKEYFFSIADHTQLQNVIGWYDPIGSVIYWHFVSIHTPVPGLLDRYVAYNVRVGRWATGYLNTNFVVSNTQETQSALQGANGGTAQGGYFFDQTNKLMSWDSAAGATPQNGYIKTGYSGDESNLSQLLRVRAKWNVNPTTDFAQAFHANILGAQPTVNTNLVRGNDDWFSLRQTDRWHGVQFNWNGAAEIVGYAFEARVAGTR